MISKSLRRDIKDVLATIAYDKIILFGSRARGDYTGRSDFDLLVILKVATSMREKIRLSTQLRKRFAAKMIDTDVLVKDRKDIDYLKDKAGSVVRSALIEGVSL